MIYLSLLGHGSQPDLESNHQLRLFGELPVGQKSTAQTPDL